MAEFARRLALHVVISLAGRLLGLGINAFTFLYIARTLGPERFGIYTLALVFVTFFATVIDNGVNITVSRMLAQRPQDAAAVLGNALALKTCAGLVLMAVAVAVAQGPWVDDRIRSVVPIASGLILVTSLSVVNAFFQARVDMRWVVAGDLLTRLSFFALALTVLTNGGDVRTLVAAQVVAAVLGALLPLGKALTLVAPGLHMDWVVWRAIVRPAVALSLSLALGMLTARFDVVALAWSVPDRELGLYSAAFRLIDLLLLIPGLMLQVVFPAFVRGDTARIQLASRYRRVAGVLLVIGLPLAALLSVAAGPATAFTAGEAYRDSAPILAALAWGMLAVFMASVMLYVLVALGLYRRLLGWSLCGTLVSVALSLALVPRYGTTGAAIATVTAHTVVLLGLARELGRQHISPWPDLIPEAASVALTVATVTVLLLPHAPIALVAGIAAGAAALLVAVLPRTRREVTALLSRE